MTRHRCTRDRNGRYQIAGILCYCESIVSCSSINLTLRFITHHILILCILKSLGPCIEAPIGVKPIGCKWVYKRKRQVDGKSETCKVRLIAKGYSKKLGLYHEKAFLPIAMLKSIKILLYILTHLDYKISQMDVKIEF